MEIWAEGRPDQIKRFIKWLDRGPEFSRVDSVENEETEPLYYNDFIIEY